MTTLTLEAARKIVSVALAEGHTRQLKPLTVAVLDAGGHLIAFEREDGASPGRYAIAQGKAYGCVMLGLGGTAQMQRAEAQAYFIAAANGAFGGQLIPVPGGVLVRDGGGAIVGAVGISGDTSDNDAAAATAGIEAAGFTPEI
jgi:uncharacterized protein GlcG (DUF336 family)